MERKNGNHVLFWDLYFALYFYEFCVNIPTPDKLRMENYIAKLNEYAQKQRLALQFVQVGAAGPDHIKT